MILDHAALAADFDTDYYVIDEPPVETPPTPTLRDPLDYRVVREQLLQLATHTAPPFQAYWTVPVDLDDVAWAEDE